MFKPNEGILDRELRITLGLGLALLGFGEVITGGVGVGLGLAGLVPLTTGLVGWCPLYSMLGVGTAVTDERGSRAALGP